MKKGPEIVLLSVNTIANPQVPPKPKVKSWTGNQDIKWSPCSPWLTSRTGRDSRCFEVTYTNQPSQPSNFAHLSRWFAAKLLNLLDDFTGSRVSFYLESAFRMGKCVGHLACPPLVARALAQKQPFKKVCWG